ncbi:MAG: hypothetical protein ACI9EF_002387 [Pseudohongiellaceae bacterium]|jgi:hypothetical protein
MTAWCLHDELAVAVGAVADGDGDVGSLRDFDPDDCLAQMIFHEICHALVAVPDAWEPPDWGLCNRDNRDLDSEYATHRLQARLAGRYGLRVFMGPTTEHRPFYDALPDNPLVAGEVSGQEISIAEARAGWEHATGGDWAAPVEEALVATAAMAQVVGDAATFAKSLWARAAP